MSKLYGDEFAVVTWRAEDVQSIKKDWSLPRCEEWLEDNEDNMKDRLTELGWEVMGALLMMEDDEDAD
jgi:hypothetical protein